MKIKKLAAICKKHKRAIIYERQIAGTEKVQQLISDGSAAYPVFGLPRLTKESLLTIFDVEQSEWDMWHVSVYDDPKDEYYQDVMKGEQQLERFYQPIVINGKLIKSVMLNGQTVFFDDAYLNPVRDEKDILYYGRILDNGSPLITVKSGMFLQAVIMPYKIEDETWIKRMEEMLAGCKHKEGAKSALTELGTVESRFA